ncbi:MAG: hypothetical protein PVH29_04920 [Candidatus Zixiibacteriota bacterium]|jgi:hypothetical protein
MVDDVGSKYMEGAGLIAARCPACGAIFSLEKSGEGYCDYCGNKIILEDSYRGKSKDIRNYYELAYAAQEVGDAAGADKYFSKVLEFDITDAVAWCGRGLAALDDRSATREVATRAVSFFKRALAHVEAEEKDRLSKVLQESCFHYAESAFERCQYKGILNEERVRGILALFDFADEVLPLDVERLKRIVAILFSYTYGTFPITYTVNYLPYSERIEKLAYYSDKIRITEPGYLNQWEKAEEKRKRRGKFPAFFRDREFVSAFLIIALFILITLILIVINCR